MGFPDPSLANIERFGALGDSITRSMMAEWGSSVTRWGFTTKAWAAYAAFLSNRTFWVDPAACEGYSGQRTDQILSSMLAASATTSFGPTGKKVTIPYGVRATGVKRCFEMSGTNDVTFYTGGDPSTAVTNRRAIWAALRAAGVEPVALSLLPRGDAYNADVPDWNDAFEAAALADGVQWIDIWTPCQTAGSWKTGYNWSNGAVDASSGLHPGADGCLLGIAPAVAAAITSAKTKTPSLVSSTQARLIRGEQQREIDVFSSSWDGLFSSASNWPKRFEPTYVSVRSVGADALADVGNALTISCGPEATEFYTDTKSPTLTVVSGERYGVFLRAEFEAGAAKPTGSDVADVIEFAILDAAFNTILAFKSGQSDAYSLDGASLPAGDIYLEFVVPDATTQIFLFVVQRTQPASTGSVVKMAQAAIVGPL